MAIGIALIVVGMLLGISGLIVIFLNSEHVDDSNFVNTLLHMFSSGTFNLMKHNHELYIYWMALAGDSLLIIGVIVLLLSVL